MSLTGYPRAGGRVGARNHLLVLPSVVCADWTAQAIASGDRAIAVVHQHGCAHVGDDGVITERAFLGFGTNPNVGGTVVVSLGCETIQGRRVADRIRERGQRMEFVGIQAEGGTARTLTSGRLAVERLRRLLAADARRPVGPDAVMLGIEAHPGTDPGLLADLGAAIATAGGSAILGLAPGVALPGGPWTAARPVGYAEPAAPGPGLWVMDGAGEGAEQHVGLAGAGAQVIVSLTGPGQAPVGFAICPVLAVAGDGGLFEALRDDFDFAPGTAAGAIWEAALAAFGGAQTASELRGARDFSLRRLSRTM